MDTLRIAEQNKEIEALRMQVFWLKHGHRKMTSAMSSFNYNVTKCFCVSCCGGGRCDGDDYKESDDDEECKFQEPFEKILQSHGLTFIHHEPEHRTLTVIHDEFADIYPQCTDCNAHFSLGYGHADWTTWRFGRLLWGASNADDPDVKKYLGLLMELESSMN
jgi:hypothetical protein